MRRREFLGMISATAASTAVLGNVPMRELARGWLANRHIVGEWAVPAIVLSDGDSLEITWLLDKDRTIKTIYHHLGKTRTVRCVRLRDDGSLMFLTKPPRGP